jgi:hypothetical protein
MGFRGSGELPIGGLIEVVWIVSLALLGCCAMAALAPPAHAEVDEIMVREVYAGGGANDSYVVLQASVPDQNEVTGSSLTAYGVTGTVMGTGTFQGDVPNGQSQMTLLVADSGYLSSQLAGPVPNLTMPSLNLNPSGGAVCWESFDCVSWGDFTGTTPSPTGENGPAMTSSVMYAINRNIDRGCPAALDADDDTDDTLADFAKRLPNPRNNAHVIPEIVCSAPSATLDEKPAKETASTSASFSFHSFPEGAELECRLRGEVFALCESGTKAYSGLAEGVHQFQIRARHSPDPAGNPASWRWRVDLTPPTTTIENPPETPNAGPDLTFYFSASEPATFECSMVPHGSADDYQTCQTQRNYLHLADGDYTFKARATDNVGHLGAPAAYEFSVDASLLDRIPPETTITSAPPPLAVGQTATFTYESSENKSLFQCRLDLGAFEFCPANGITYDHLALGHHTFEVRARDEKANVDPTPAARAFDVGPAPIFEPLPRTQRPDTRLTGKPGARTRQRTPTLRFASSEPGAVFQCKLDSSPFFKKCRSPLTTPPLAPGRHSFRVRSVIDGVADPTPASVTFKVIGTRRAPPAADSARR